MDNADFPMLALARLQQHFLVVRTPPTDRGGHVVSCTCKALRHSTQGGVLVPLDRVCPQHAGAPCWSGRLPAWFWIGTFGHPQDLLREVSGLFVHRYTGSASGGTSMPHLEEVEYIKVFDDESLDEFLHAEGLS